MPARTSVSRGAVNSAGVKAALSTLRPIQYFPRDHPHMNMWGDLQSGALSMATVQADFATLVSWGCNCIRLVVHAQSSGPACFQIGPGTPPTPTQLGWLTTVLLAAAAAGLQVWMLLFDHYQGTDGSHWVVADSQAWLTSIITALPPNWQAAGPGGKSLIPVVEVLNEVTQSSPFTDGNTGKTYSQLWTTWVPGILPAVRQAFPGSLITVSVLTQPNGASGWLPDGSGDARWLYNTVLGGNPYLLDFLNIHGYTDWGQFEANSMAYKTVQEVFGPNLAIADGEYGFPTTYSDSSYTRLYGSASSGLPSSLAHREALQEYNLRLRTFTSRQLGTNDPLIWQMYDIPGMDDQTVSFGSLSEVGGGGTFTSGQIVKVKFRWTNSLGGTNGSPPAVSAATLTIATTGDSAQLPTQLIPFGATGLQVYVSTVSNGSTYNLWTGTGGTQTGLVGNGTNTTAAVTITAFGSSGTQPPGSNTSSPSSYQNIQVAEYAFGVLRHLDEPNAGLLKPAGLTLQQLWLNNAALSTYFNGDFEMPPVPDFAGVVKWPPLWRYEPNGGSFITAVQSTTKHAGSQALQITNGYSPGGGTTFADIAVVPIYGVLDQTKTYTLTAFIFVQALPASYAVFLQITWLTAAMGFISNAQTAIAAVNGGFTQYTVAAKPPLNAYGCYAQVAFQAVGSSQPGTAHNIYIDDVTFTFA